MKLRTIGRHIREGFKNVARNKWMTVASIVSVMITLLILGVVMLAAFNVDYMAEHLESDVEIRAFVEQEADREVALDIEEELQEMSQVEEIYFIPKEDGIEELIDNLGEDGRHFEDLVEDDQNPLPDTFVIQAQNPQHTPHIAEEVEAIDHIYDVNYGGETTEMLFNVTNSVRNIGIVFIIGLAFTAMLLISNTIKTTINARRTEIEIMKLVGATNSFVRWPFFIEGMLLGVIGALIPSILLVLGYQQLFDYVQGSVLHLDFVHLLPTYPVVFQIAAVLVGLGAFIGVWGSLVSVRRFLKV